MIQPNRSADQSADSHALSVDSVRGSDPIRGLGLLTHVRQGYWLRGLSHRCRQGALDRQAMVERQAHDTASLQASLLAEHESTLTDCRIERKSVLSKWDQSDEHTIATYESQTIATRNQMNHDLAALRKKRKHDIAAEEQWYDTEVNQVQTHYAEEKPKPGLQHKQELGLIEKRSARLNENLEGARELTMRRIGGPKGLERLNAAAATPTGSAEAHDSLEGRAVRTVKECLAELDRLGDTSEALLADLRSGWAAKFLESFYLLAVMIAVAAIWAGATFFVGPTRMALWMLAGIPVAVVVGVITHTLLGFPLRKQTKAIHPHIERGFVAGLKLIENGKQLSNARAKQWATELVRNRDNALEQLRLTHAEKMQGIKDRFQSDNQQTTADFEAKLAKIEQTFQEVHAALSRQMFSASEETASRLAARLADTDLQQQQRLNSQNDSHNAEIEFLRLRVEQGVRQGLQRVRENQQSIAERFPDWGRILAEHESEAESLRWLPLGDLNIASHLRGVLNDPSIDIPTVMPLVLPRESQSTVVIDCPPDQMHVAAEWVRAVLWRGLTAVRPGRLRLTLLDPVGRGQNFASLVSLGDHDPLLIGHRAWVSTQQIQERLTELTQHIEDVLQACLRDRYQTIEDFNRDAGPLAEPYRVLAAFGLPIGLNRDSAESLRALIEGGRRCGVYSILVRDTSQPWSSDLPSLPDSQVLRLRIDDMGRIWHAAPGLEAIQVSPIVAPPVTAIPVLSERIGQGAIAAHRVEIPLDDCIPADEYDSGSSAKGLSIPVGRQGVGRFLEIQLGTGMRQHMLVAGKTGSGKSTLLHSLIMAASLKYSPEELQLYLLDFKKGVEFKIYAEAQLPHARVIGIESEREFGRSVLQRLDEELQRRGELFRAAGVQDLADYRHHSHSVLPRILFIVDEFQELFVRDDRVAQECTMLLDRLVRQGRSFGMHVVLSSQSLSGAYTLPRATLGQMAIRIALQCSESDAALILADDNTAARLLSRPGEAIFNDAGGLIEGNQPFQVAWMGQSIQRERMQDILDRHPDAAKQFGLTVVFEGNRPARWTVPLVETAIASSIAASGSDTMLNGLLGEAVRIGPPTTLSLSQSNGRNVLCVADLDTTNSVLATWLPTAVVDAYRRTSLTPEIVILDGSRVGEGTLNLSQWLADVGIQHQAVKLRESEQTIISLAAKVAGQISGETAEGPPTLVVIVGLERFRDFRQDENFGFSLDGSASATGATALQALLRDGPQVGCYVFLGCSGAETLARWLPRTSQHDLEIRLIGRISANDSAQLIDTPEATDLSNASMFFYDDADGRLEKFRICDVPSAEHVRAWMGPSLPKPDGIG